MGAHDFDAGGTQSLLMAMTYKQHIYFERKISMKKTYTFSIFLFIFCLTGCQKINNEVVGANQEQEFFEKTIEMENMNVIEEIEPNEVYIDEAEKQEYAEEYASEIDSTWQDAYKNIISNIESNLSDPYNFISESGSFNEWFM